MSSERVRVRLLDIVLNATRIAKYIEGHDSHSYPADDMVQDAVERCLERITEAVVQIGEQEAGRVGLGIPWQKVRALGNRLRHEYRVIDSAVIFATVSIEVPALRAAAIRALDHRG